MRTIKEPSNTTYARLIEWSFAEAEGGSAGRAVSLSVDPKDGDGSGAAYEVPERGGGDEGSTRADCGLGSCEHWGDSGYGGDSGCGGGDSGRGCSGGEFGDSAGIQVMEAILADSGMTLVAEAKSGGCC